MAVSEAPLLKKQIKEIGAFLKNVSPDARHKAMEIFASLSTLEEHANVCAELKLGKSFFKQIGVTNIATSKLALTVLVNMSSFTFFRRHLYTCKGATDIVMDVLRDKECSFKDLATLFFINFTQEEEGQQLLCQKGEKLEGLHVKRIVGFFASDPRSRHYARLNDVICNITQCPTGRKIVLEVVSALVDILPWADHHICRGVLGSIRNICFDSTSHEKLISEELGLMVQMQIFLCGPAEELDEEDLSAVMPAVQAKMDIDKERCPDKEVRSLILDIIHFLVTEQPNRQYLRDIGLYYVLREYDKWEEDEENNEKVEELVNFLKRDDPSENPEDDDKIKYTTPDNVQSFHKYEGQKKQVPKPTVQENETILESKEDDEDYYVPSLFTKNNIKEAFKHNPEEKEEESDEESESIDLEDMGDMD